MSLGQLAPPYLMTSGVGDADELSEHGIDLHQHLPGVGKTCKTTYKRGWFSNAEPTLNDEVNSIQQLGIGVQYTDTTK